MCFLAVLSSQVSAGPQIVEFDRWYTVLLQSKASGWMHMTVVRRGDRVETNTETKISVKRGVVLSIEMAESFTETVDGEPLETHLVQKFAGQAITTTLKFEGDKYILTTGVGEANQRREDPASDDPWLTPLAAERYVAQQMADGAKQITYRTLALSAGHKPVEVTHTIAGRRDIEVMGKTVSAIERSTRFANLPNMKTTEYVDDQGHLVKTTMKIGAMVLDLVESDAQLAQAQVNPPDLMAQVLVRTNRRIPHPRKVRSAVYELRLADTDVDDADSPNLTLPTTGHQRVLEANGDFSRVRVDMDQLQAPGDDKPTDAHRTPSTMINSADPQIQALARRALKASDKTMSDGDRAQALCRFVHGYIENRDLSVGFATASEVAATAHGDCTEFAVLLAALLRAEGVPSRTVSGLVYVERFVGQEHLFGYHMWSQAWIGSDGDGRWVDLDAALNPDEFDAAHLTISTSALADADMFNDMVVLAPLLGRLSIRVIETNRDPPEAGPSNP